MSKDSYIAAAAALGGVMFTLTSNTDSAADAVKKLTDNTVKLDKAQRMLVINEAEKENSKNFRLSKKVNASSYYENFESLFLKGSKKRLKISYNYGKSKTRKCCPK